MNILVTGGAGYIGSHTIIELIAAGHSVIAIDNFSNSSRESLRRVEKIAGQAIPFYEADVRNRTALETIFNDHKIDAVIHFAGLKAVGESVEKPLLYYENNLDTTFTLLAVMKEKNVRQIVFSSSATVYGTPETLPLTEDSPVGINLTNPYGKTKYMIEEILRDVTPSIPGLSTTVLRYFNPVGAHDSGLIGEDPQGVPNNLMPFIAQVAVGKREKLSVFGDDYDTPDGTCIRDYIHVVDLAKGHVAAIENSAAGFDVFNLGTGKGTTVLELVHAFEAASGKNIPYEIVGRRAGDVASSYANAEKAERILGWKAEKTIEDACRDSWHWQSQNPNGFKTND